VGKTKNEGAKKGGASGTNFVTHKSSWGGVMKNQGTVWGEKGGERNSAGKEKKGSSLNGPLGANVRGGSGVTDPRKQKNL